MTTQRDPETILAAWLDEGPKALPDVTRLAILTAVPTTVRARRGAGTPTLPGLLATPNRTRLFAMVALVAAMAMAGVILLVAGAGPRPSPTPDGSAAPSLLAPIGFAGTGTITFTRNRPSGSNDLWLIDPDGMHSRLLVQGGCCGLFSPDGMQLAVGAPGVSPFGARDATLQGIEVFDHPTPTAAFVIPTGCGACEVLELNYLPDAWSPNGRYVALDMWSDTDPGKAGLGIADRDFPALPWDWGLTRSTGVHRDVPIAFSPDSSMLLFMREEQTSGSTSTGPLFVLRLADNTIRLLSPGLTVSTNGLTQGPASWSPDGGTIAFAGADGSGNVGIYSTGIDPNSPLRTVVSDARGATSARFSPDGGVIAFDRAGSGGLHDLYLVGADGTGEVDLTSSFEPGVCCAEWSPDGTALLVAGTLADDAHSDLFIVSRSGGGVWQLTTAPGKYSAFQWGAGFR